MSNNKIVSYSSSDDNGTFQITIPLGQSPFFSSDIRQIQISTSNGDDDLFFNVNKKELEEIIKTLQVALESFK